MDSGAALTVANSRLLFLPPETQLRDLWQRGRPPEDSNCQDIESLQRSTPAGEREYPGGTEMNPADSGRQNIELSGLAVIWTFFLLAALFFAAGGHLPALQGQAERSTSSPHRNVIAFNLEHKLATAEKQQDKAFFQKTLDDRLVYVAYNGLVLDKAKLLSSMKYVDVNNYSMKNLKERELGPDAELVTYDLNINGDIAGRELPQKQYASSVWLKTAGGWKLVFHQATPAHHG